MKEKQHILLKGSILSVLFQEQASWVCECEESLVLRLEQDFKSTLQEQNSLEQWATWLEGVVNTVLEPYEGGDKFSQAARQFLLKWSFYRCVRLSRYVSLSYYVLEHGNTNSFSFFLTSCLPLLFSPLSPSPSPFLPPSLCCFTSFSIQGFDDS